MSQATVYLPRSINFDVLSFLSSKFGELKGNTSLKKLTLDFSGVGFIDPEGALSIVCFSGILFDGLYKGLESKNIEIFIKPPNADVISYLEFLGFFTQMKNRCGLVGYETQVRKEISLRGSRRLSGNQKFSSLPFETIEAKRKTSMSGSEDFEHMVGTFNNHTHDVFRSYFIREGKIDMASMHDFLLSNVEMYQNIFEHSQSWGMASIMARQGMHIKACFFDTGVGFKKSVGRFETEKESVSWALIDGNTGTAGANNDGAGLNFMLEFVTRQRGEVKIRSGNCLTSIRESKGIQIVYQDVPDFPGVQLSFQIPSR